MVLQIIEKVLACKEASASEDDARFEDIFSGHGLLVLCFILVFLMMDLFVTKDCFLN